MTFEDGWFPGAVRRDSVSTYGYPGGTRGQNQPILFIDHIMAGWKSTLDNAAWRQTNGVGVTFGIGRDGSKSQYCSIWDAHWGNGVSGNWQRYDRNNRHLAFIEGQGSWVQVSYAGTVGYALIKGGVNQINARSIATEHEGFPGDVWDPRMVASSIETKLWTIEAMRSKGIPVVVDNDLIAGHFQIDSVNRPSCPGPNHPKAAILAGLSVSQEDEMLDENDPIVKKLLKVHDALFDESPGPFWNRAGKMTRINKLDLVYAVLTDDADPAVADVPRFAFWEAMIKQGAQPGAAADAKAIADELAARLKT